MGKIFSRIFLKLSRARNLPPQRRTQAAELVKLLTITAIIFGTLFPILPRPAGSSAHPYYRMTLYPVADAYVRSREPTRNHGLESVLEIGSQPSLEFRPLSYVFIKFDLSALPADAEIVSAQLVLFLKEGSRGRVEARRIVSPWEEGMVTWGSRPTIQRRLALFPPIYADVRDSPGEYSWDVTAWVRGWLQGAYPNYGVALLPLNEEEEFLCIFYSREYRSRDYARRRPKLVVMYESSEPPSETEPPEELPEDTTRPRVTIHMSPTGDISPGEEIRIEASATDDVGLSYFELRIEPGGRFIPWTPEGPGEREATINFRGSLEAGQYTATATAWDSAGNSDARVIHFRVGTGTKPTIALSVEFEFPEGGPYTPLPNDRSTIVATVTAADPEGIRRLKVGVGTGMSDPDAYPDFARVFTFDPPYPDRVTRTVTFTNYNVPVGPHGEVLGTETQALEVEAIAQDSEGLWSDLASERVELLRPYPWDYGLPYRNLRRRHLPWRVMNDVFGYDETHRCLGDKCWRTVKARIVYDDVEDIAKNGHCFGFSAYSLTWAHHEEPIPDDLTHVGEDAFIYPESHYWWENFRSKTKRSIERFHAAQLSDEVLDHFTPMWIREGGRAAFSICHTPPFIEDQLPRLVDDVEAGTPGVVCITRDESPRSPGHCMVPWYVDETPAGDIRIFVYDPNRNFTSTYPSTHYGNRDIYPYILVDDCEISFRMAGGEVWHGYIVYAPYGAAVKNNYALPDGLEYLSILFGSSGPDMYAVDETGRRTGVVGGEAVVEIEGSTPMFIPTLSEGKVAYALPPGQPYEFRISGGKDGEYRWAAVASSSAYLVANKTGSASNGDAISFQPEGDSLGYSMRLRAGVGDGDFGIAMEHELPGNVTREYELVGVSIGDWGDLEVYAGDGGNSLILVNRGPDPVEADVVFRSTESGVADVGRYAVNPGERVRIAPNWGDLTGTPPEVSVEAIKGPAAPEGRPSLPVGNVAVAAAVLSAVLVAAALASKRRG